MKPKRARTPSGTHTERSSFEGRATPLLPQVTRDELRQSTSPARQCATSTLRQGKTQPTPQVNSEGPNDSRRPHTPDNEQPTSSSVPLPSPGDKEMHRQKGTGCYDPNPCSGRQVAPKRQQHSQDPTRQGREISKGRGNPSIGGGACENSKRSQEVEKRRLARGGSKFEGRCERRVLDQARTAELVSRGS